MISKKFSLFIVVRNMDNPRPKHFLTKNIEYDLVNICFYSDLEEGEYLCIEALNYCVYDVIIAPEKRRGWYSFCFLMYNESQKKIMRLYPCYYTRKKMKEYFKNLYEDDNLIFVLKKDKRKPNVRRPPSPKWEEADIREYFKYNQVFRPINNYNSVKLVGIREKEIIDRMIEEEEKNN